MNEQLANLGYLAIKKETTPGVVAATPNIFVPLYSESLATDGQYVEDSPIMASKFFRYRVARGLRQHKGGFVVMAEPNTAANVLDMTFPKISSTGANPTTHTFKPVTDRTNSYRTNSYTVEIGLENMAVRFMGYGASKIALDRSDGLYRFNVDGNALKAFTTRTVTSVTGSGPYVINLDTDYDTKPTLGLVVGDAIQVFDVSANSRIAAVVDALTDTTITVSENVSAAASGDILTLQPQQPSWNVLDSFDLGRTEFHFGATADEAMSNAHTPLEQDSSITLIHEFNSDGEARSGSYDPASLIRTRADIEFTERRYFDTPEEMNRWQQIGKRALVIRMFAEQGTELRITMNDIRAIKSPRPQLSASEVLYSETDYRPVVDVTDGQAFDVKVLNQVSSI